MPQLKTLINGTAYAFSQIIISIFNTPIAGVTAISYDDEQEMQDNYGAGNRPVSRGYGNIKCSGSITLAMEEIEALQAASPTGRLQDIPEFGVVVSYQPPVGKIVTHTLKDCKFKKNARDMKQGDMKSEMAIPLLISEIKWK